jgi:hypothetical protein
MPTALCEFCRKDKSKKKKKHKKEHDKKEKKKTSGIGVLTCSFEDNAVTSHWGPPPHDFSIAKVGHLLAALRREEEEACQEEVQELIFQLLLFFIFNYQWLWR